MKYIFVTGGVLSSLGKGVTSASIGTILEAHDITVNIMKLDPYINVDPGTMNPFQHGEVYVTEDGAETDLDLGHYERFTTIHTSKINNATTGQIYNNVISKERKGVYLGQTVQVIPHITDEIKNAIYKASEAHKVDVLIVEVGGTVGDIESMPFIEAIRQIGYEKPEEDVMYIHLTLVPFLKSSGELKSKPTQHSVKELRSLGIQPDVLLCRTEYPIDDGLRKKIALHCSMHDYEVIPVIDVENIYEVPVNLKTENLDGLIIRKYLKLSAKIPDMNSWKHALTKATQLTKSIRIAIVGKYTGLHDSYKSLMEAIKHASWAQRINPTIEWVDAEELVDLCSCVEYFSNVDAILVPGGFGTRGIEGKIKAIEYARRRNIPFFGICLGMQCAIIEFARNVCSLEDANSTEFDKRTNFPVVHLISKWYDPKTNSYQERDIKSPKGGTLRLGSYPCKIMKDSLADAIYGSAVIEERHRHRFEVNNLFLLRLKEFGLVVGGESPDGELVETIELDHHPFFFGCQFHPEFNSRFLMPHPIFMAFTWAAYENKEKKD